MYATLISSMKTFIFFACAALIWEWVLPIWQGPDETAHFSYVQYMEYHQMPPDEKAVAPGKQPWVTSASPAVVHSRQLTQYNVLHDPSRNITVSPADRQATLADIQSVSNIHTNEAGSQNYVGIYPPLYYGVVGKLLHFINVQDVNKQAYIARLCSVFIFGIFGVVLERMIRSVMPERDWRAALVYSIPLLFPTLAMLGGVVNNDVLMDTMCLALCCLMLDAMHREEWTKWVALGYGAVFGVALITKPDTYVVGLVTGAVILRRLWLTVKPRRRIISFAGIGAIPLVLLAGPWLFVAARYYHSIMSPLTYQATGHWPRTTAWFVTHLLMSPSYERSVMVFQTVSGINFPWWPQPVQSQVFYNVWSVVVCGLLLYGAYRLFRTSKGLFGVSLAWVGIVFLALWYTTYTYLLKTGTHFLQGRYFFMMLPVAAYMMALALKRNVFLLRLLPLFSLFIFATVLNATVERFYGQNLLSMVMGHVGTYDPTFIISLGRLSVAVLCAMVLWCVMKLRSDSKVSDVDESNHSRSHQTGRQIS